MFAALLAARQHLISAVRLVLGIHPTRGRRISLCADTTLDGIEVVRIYGVRIRIELTFKQAVHSVDS